MTKVLIVIEEELQERKIRENCVGEGEECEEDDDEDIFKIGGLWGPPRLLFTITEETMEEMELELDEEKKPDDDNDDDKEEEEEEEEEEEANSRGKKGVTTLYSKNSQFENNAHTYVLALLNGDLCMTLTVSCPFNKSPYFS